PMLMMGPIGVAFFGAFAAMGVLAMLTPVAMPMKLIDMSELPTVRGTFQLAEGAETRTSIKIAPLADIDPAVPVIEEVQTDLSSGQPTLTIYGQGLVKAVEGAPGDVGTHP